MSDQAIILCTFGIDETQRDQLQAFIKANSEAWWHQQPDVWIILDDKSQTYWYDHLSAIFHNSAKYIMLKLPERGARAYATKGYATWLRENYYKGAESEGDEPTGYKFDEEPF